MRAQEYRTGGARLSYRVSGEGDPIILVHGLSGSGRWWRRNVPALAASHRVYVLDLVGYGRAYRQRALGVRDAAALIAALIEDLGMERVTLVGHSMGGHICTHVAARSGARVRNLVLACASGLLTGNIYRVALGLPKAAVTGRLTFVPRVLADAARAGPVNVWRSTTDLLGDNVADLLPTLTARTLVVWGARDALVPPRIGRVLAEAIPGARYEEIPRAGHVVMVDAPARFNALVLDFLAQGDREAEVAQAAGAGAGEP